MTSGSVKSKVAELDVVGLMKLDLSLVSLLSVAPLCLKTALSTGVMWCLQGD